MKTETTATENMLNVIINKKSVKGKHIWDTDEYIASLIAAGVLKPKEGIILWFGSHFSKGRAGDDGTAFSVYQKESTIAKTLGINETTAKTVFKRIKKDNIVHRCLNRGKGQGVRHWHVGSKERCSICTPKVMDAHEVAFSRSEDINSLEEFYDFLKESLSQKDKDFLKKHQRTQTDVNKIVGAYREILMALGIEDVSIHSDYDHIKLKTKDKPVYITTMDMLDYVWKTLVEGKGKRGKLLTHTIYPTNLIDKQRGEMYKPVEPVENIENIVNEKITA